MPLTTLPRRWNHLKMIRTTLANLRGGGSLANELIQNADDADGARRLVFRFTGDYLEVSDDGGFRACQQPNDPEDCPWEADGRRPCDFHAFRELGAASKANDPNLTGAFGIGFLAVYQITDRPELFSHGIHWILDEAEEVVNVCDGRCGELHVTTGTTFRLPWAKEMTYLREQLAAETVSAEDRRRLLRQFVEQVPKSMIFLHNLRKIKIIDERSTSARFSRLPDGQKVRVTGPSRDEEWLILEGDFNAQAEVLRRQHPTIGTRHADVRIALRPGNKVNGNLYATLPTIIPTGLPLHLDASFFPRLDRKGILLESGYEAEWNRAAITAAAELLAAQVEQLAPVLGPEPFWRLVDQAHALERERTAEAKALTAIWEHLRKALPPASVMWTRAGEWARVSEVVAPPRDQVLADLLEDLRVPVVSPLIQGLVPSRPLGISQISLDRLLAALEKLGLAEGATLEELPEPLRPGARRTALRRLLGTLVGIEELEASVRDRIRGLALWEGVDGRFRSFSASWLVTRETIQPFARFSEYAFALWPARDSASRALTHVGDVYTTEAALDDLERSGGELAKVPVREARGILSWFRSRLAELSDAEIERLACLRLIPTEQGLRSARETVRAGGFHDPLGLTSVLDRGGVEGLDELINRFAIRQLSFAKYLREHVAGLEQLGKVPMSALVELIRQCVRHRDTIDTDPELIQLLTDLAWIPCSDLVRRQPGEVYFSSALVREVLGTSAPFVHSSIRLRTASSDLLRLLGVSSVPRPADVVANIRKIVAEPPNEERITQVAANLRYLAKSADELDPAFAPLRKLAWLPDEGEKEWHVPGRLYLNRNRTLFATTGRFIARVVDQDGLRTILSALGVQSSPSVHLVVDHVINLAVEDKAAALEILRWLDSHAQDPQIGRLGDSAFLPTADGRLERADRVFRQRHQLVPWRAVLRPGLERLTNLLDALKVAHTPDGRTAEEVLLEISGAATRHEKLDAQTLAVVNRCWEMLASGTDADLDLLDGHDVVPAADGCLHRTDEVLLQDLPGTEHWLSAAACQRLVALDGRQYALQAAGVRRLSQSRHGEVLGSTQPVDGHWIESRLMERWAQLARIVDAEGGNWRGVVELTQNAEVEAVGALTVRYWLDDLAGLPENPAVEEGAFFARDSSQIFVRVTDERPDLQALARVLRDEILPGRGPATSLVIKTALAARSCSEADADLAEYPPLRDEVFAEFEQLLQEQAQQGDFIDDTDVNADTDDSEQNEDDADVDDVSSADQTPAEADDPEPEDRNNDDQDQPGGRSANSGDGTSDRSPAGRGSGTGRAGSGQPNDRPNGSTSASGTKRGRSGRKNDAGADYRLISYVERNGGERSDDDGSRDQRSRDAAGEAGVDLVIGHLETELSGSGRRIEKMPEKNKGYDILVWDADGNPERYIEVKATAGPWGHRGVGLTEPQFSLARREGRRYWLYVVEHLYQAEARIWWIHDPAGQVTHFYYDHGWQGAAEGQVAVVGARAESARSSVKKLV